LPEPTRKATHREAVFCSTERQDAGRDSTMCMKGRQSAPREAGNYECKRCGATHAKKSKLCKPKKIK
jgi:hypothetical protein